MAKLQLKARVFRTLETSSAVKLPFPIDAKVRLAALSESTPAFGIVKPVHARTAAGLQSFRPNIIAGTTQELQDLAQQVESGKVNLSSVDHALIALTRWGQAPLTDLGRVVLWQAFGVPVYEIWVGLDNSILGYECELHEGWHLPKNVGLTGLASGELVVDAPGARGLGTRLMGRVTRETCPCGREGRRLLGIVPVMGSQTHQERAAIA